MKRSSIGEYIGVVGWIFGGLNGLIGLVLLGLSFTMEEMGSLVLLILGAFTLLMGVVATLLLLGYAQLIKSNEDIKMLLDKQLQYMEEE